MENRGNLAVVFAEKCGSRRIVPNEDIVGRLSHGTESLREIDLSGIPYNDSFDIVFEMLMMITETRVFRMSNCDLKDFNILKFAQSMSLNRSVRSIDLSGNAQITLASASPLLELVRRKRNILRLNVERCGISANEEFVSKMNFLVGGNIRINGDHEQSSDEEFDVRKFSGTITNLPRTASVLARRYQSEVEHGRKNGDRKEGRRSSTIEEQQAHIVPRRGTTDALEQTVNVEEEPVTLERSLSTVGVPTTELVITQMVQAASPWLSAIDDMVVLTAWYNKQHSLLVYIIFAAICLGGENLIVPCIPLLLWYQYARQKLLLQTMRLNVHKVEYPKGPLRLYLDHASEWSSGTGELSRRKRLHFAKLVVKWLDRCKSLVASFTKAPLGQGAAAAAMTSAFLYAVPLPVILFLMGTACFVLVPMVENENISKEVSTLLTRLITMTTQQSTQLLEDTLRDGGTAENGIIRRELRDYHFIQIQVLNLVNVTLPHQTHKSSVHVHASYGAHTATTSRKYCTFEWNESLCFSVMDHLDTVTLSVYDVGGSSDFVGSATLKLTETPLDVPFELDLSSQRFHVEDEELLENLMSDLKRHDDKEKKKYTDFYFNKTHPATPVTLGSDKPIRASQIRMILRLE